MFAERNLHPDKIAYIGDEESLASLIIAGSGMGLMLEERALQAERKGDVVIWGHEAFSLPLSFVYQEKRKSDPLLQAVLGVLDSVWA